MNNIKTLIKWPGGKAHEIKYIENLIPEYDRYIEPFFGGGCFGSDSRSGRMHIGLSKKLCISL